MAFYRCVPFISKSADELPAGYTRVKYISTNNRKQYIKLPIHVTLDDYLTQEYESDGVWAQSSNAGGTVEGNTTPACFHVGTYYSASNTLFYGNGTADATTGIVLDKTKRYVLKNSLKVGKVYVKGEEKVNFVPRKPNAVNTFFGIFVWLLADGSVSPYSAFQYYAKKYSVKYWYGGLLQHNLIPCLDDSMKPGMYDTVQKMMLYNSGEGEFGYELMDGTYVAPI